MDRWHCLLCILPILTLNGDLYKYDVNSVSLHLYPESCKYYHSPDKSNYQTCKYPLIPVIGQLLLEDVYSDIKMPDYHEDQPQPDADFQIPNDLLEDFRDFKRK